MGKPNFWSLSFEERFAAYDVIKSHGCKTYNSAGANHLAVAVAKGKYGAVSQALESIGFKQINLYKFPIGTDNPEEHFNHEGNWLVACFIPL